MKGMWYTMNEGYRAWGMLKSVLNKRFGDKCEKVTVNCTNCVVPSRGIEYEKC